MQVHKLEMLVVDHDGIGDREIVAVLENQKFPNWCISPKVMKIETEEVEWSDDHPLNKKAEQAVAFQALFGSNVKAAAQRIVDYLRESDLRPQSLTELCALEGVRLAYLVLGKEPPP